MFIDIFGPRGPKDRCGDCIQFGDTWYCTMNCGPSVPPEVTHVDKADAAAAKRRVPLSPGSSRRSRRIHSNGGGRGRPR